MPTRPIPSEPILISFSGLDGAGKTTQINALREAITHLGLRSRLITFWDDVVVGTQWRESFVHKVLGSEQGIGAPGRPVERRDKNIRSGYLTALRHLLYLFDAINLRLVIYRVSRSESQVIIIDRYLFDELANLPLHNRLSALFAKLLARIAPRPQLAFLLDVDPSVARARKPEYSVDFMRESRKSYFRLAELLGCMAVIPPLSIEDARHAILTTFLRILGKHQAKSTGAGVAPAA